MGTRILLAGGESKDLMETLIKSKTRFILFSYWYIKNKLDKDNPYLKEFFKSFEYVLLDSGAFTFFNELDVTYKKVEAYAWEYAEFLSQYKDSISAAVELDLYQVPSVGLKAHDIRRNILEKAGVPILPVYHADLMSINHQDRDDWREFCSDYRYVGVGSALVKRGVSSISGLINEAKTYNTRVHGFGITRQDFLKRSRFYTADSTSWLNGQIYGSTFIFEHNKLRIYDNLHKENARTNMNIKRWERAGIDLSGLKEDKRTTITPINCWEWTQFQNWLYDQNNSDYWDNSEELNPLREGVKIVVPKKKIFRENFEEYEDEVVDSMTPEEKEKAEKEVVEMFIPKTEVETIEIHQTRETGAVDEVLKELTNISTKGKAPVIRTIEDYFRIIKEDKEYRFTDKLDKKRWNSTFKKIDGNKMHETRYNQLEGWMEFDIYLDGSAVENIKKEDKDYNRYLRQRCDEKYLEGREANKVDKSKNELVVRDEINTLQMFDTQKLSCVDCYLGDRCEHFNEAGNCLYAPATIQKPGDLVDSLSRLMGVQFSRVLKGALIEKLDGGVLDKITSEEIKKTFDMAMKFKEILSAPKETITIEASGKNSTGLLAGLFGSINKKPEGE